MWFPPRLTVVPHSPPKPAETKTHWSKTETREMLPTSAGGRPGLQGAPEVAGLETVSVVSLGYHWSTVYYSWCYRYSPVALL